MATRKAGTTEVGTASVTPAQPPVKETRAQRSARRRAEAAAEHAAREAAKNPPLASLVNGDHFPGLGQEVISPPEPIVASPRRSSRGRAGGDAGAGAGAHEGVVLADDEFAGLMDVPVPPDTPATARYRGLQHEATPATEAQVMALRYASGAAAI